MVADTANLCSERYWVVKGETEIFGGCSALMPNDLSISWIEPIITGMHLNQHRLRFKHIGYRPIMVMMKCSPIIPTGRRGVARFTPATFL